jgi:hypothetical protein
MNSDQQHKFESYARFKNDYQSVVTKVYGYYTYLKIDKKIELAEIRILSYHEIISTDVINEYTG